MGKKYIFPRDKNGKINIDKIGQVKSFKTKKREYFPETSLTIGRTIEFSRLQTIISTGYSTSDLTKKHLELIEDLNSVKLVDASIKAMNLLEHTSRMENRISAALEMCALFFNEKNEDRTIWNDSIKDSKINDWKEFGFEMEDFFLFSLFFLQDFKSELAKQPKALEKIQKALTNLFSKS